MCVVCLLAKADNRIDFCSIQHITLIQNSCQLQNRYIKGMRYYGVVIVCSKHYTHTVIASCRLHGWLPCTTDNQHWRNFTQPGNLIGVVFTGLTAWSIELEDIKLHKIFA